MSQCIEIHIFDEFDEAVAPEWIRAVSESVLSMEPEWARESLSVVVGDDECVTALNLEYRGLNETTDVLSFSNLHSGQYYGEGERPKTDDEGFALPPGYSDNLGEVIISYPQVVRQANESNHNVQKELAVMLAHGILHLLGYDHEREDEAAEMFGIQNRAIVALERRLQL